MISTRCSNCKNRYHVHCMLMSNEEYDEIMSNNVTWTCPMSQCIGQPAPQQLVVPLINTNESDQSTKCAQCNFIAKNVKGLKIHSRIHKKTNSDADQSIKVSTNIRTTDNDSSNRNESTDRTSRVEEGNDDLIPCLLCNDGKLFKKNGGLRIHCTRRHKNQDCEFMFEQSNNFDSKLFEDKISRLEQNVRVIKRIPKGARIIAAYKLTEIMKKTANKNDSASWEELLLFPFKAFKVPENNKKSLTKLVKNNIKNDELFSTFKMKSNKPGSLSKRVESKVAGGDIRGAKDPMFH